MPAVTWHHLELRPAVKNGKYRWLFFGRNIGALRRKVGPDKTDWQTDALRFRKLDEPDWTEAKARAWAAEHGFGKGTTWTPATGGETKAPKAKAPKAKAPKATAQQELPLQGNPKKEQTPAQLVAALERAVHGKRSPQQIEQTRRLLSALEAELLPLEAPVPAAARRRNPDQADPQAHAQHALQHCIPVLCPVLTWAISEGRQPAPNAAQRHAAWRYLADWSYSGESRSPWGFPAVCHVEQHGEVLHAVDGHGFGVRLWRDGSAQWLEPSTRSGRTTSDPAQQWRVRSRLGEREGTAYYPSEHAARAAFAQLFTAGATWAILLDAKGKKIVKFGKG